MDTSDATLTFAVVVILIVVGVTLVMCAELLRAKLMPWLKPPRSE